MGTVSKALSLLDFFNGERAEISLADLTRLSGYDKATARRLLIELSEHGFVEQNPVTKAYRIGPGPLRLARLRSERFPIVEVARPVADQLSAVTGETVHVSELSGERLATIYVADAPRANRVFVPIGEVLPFNCTASGMAMLAFGPPGLAQKILSRPLPSMTSRSITDPEILARDAAKIRASGISVSEQGFEEGVQSFAAPIYGLAGYAIGAVSVAIPVSRASSDHVALIGREVRKAAGEIARGLFGDAERN